jgi:uncharacterized protein (TIRG00374 family)
MVAIFLRNSKKQNTSTLTTGIGISFVMLFEVLAFVIVAILSMATLFVFGHAAAYLYITLLILVGLVAVVILFIFQLAIYKQPPSRPVLWLIKLIARLAGQKKVELIDIEKLFREIGDDIAENSGKLKTGLWLAITTHLINIVTLTFIFLAFAGHFNPLAVLAAYTAGLLYTIVSITPQGVGVVETIMIATIHSFGLDLPTSAVVTLVFRSLLYWLPVFAGFYCFSRLEFEPKRRDLIESIE